MLKVKLYHNLIILSQRAAGAEGLYEGCDAVVLWRYQMSVYLSKLSRQDLWEDYLYLFLKCDIPQ